MAALSGCGGSNDATPSGSGIAVPASVQPALPGGEYAVSVFAQSSGSLRPDDLLQVGSAVFVVHQDSNINPDGTLANGVVTAQSTVVEYDLGGKVLQTFKVPGHPDGMTSAGATTVWVGSNEDANPLLTVIDTVANTVKTYTCDQAQLPHGGGLDDMKLLGGVVYGSASNPTTTATPSPNLAPYSMDGNGSTAQFGVKTGPVTYSVSLNADGTTYHATPVVYSNIPATLLPGNTAVTLNRSDADSSAIDPNGNLVETSQQDSELVFIHNIGMNTQSVSVLPVTLHGNPWPLDDTRWSPATGASFMLVSDASAQLVYRIDAASGDAPSTAYSAGQGTVLQTNTTTGVLTPIFVGMNTPHGLIFVSD